MTGWNSGILFLFHSNSY